MRNLSEQELVRREKMQKIRDLGIDPFGSRFDRTAYAKDIVLKYQDIPHDDFENIDDIFIAVFVLRKVADKFGYEFLEKYWDHEEDLKKIMDNCYDNSLELLGDKTYSILSYVGLMK